MGLESYITDIATGSKVSVDNDNGLEKNSLVVATRPLKRFNNVTKAFINPDYGYNMNVNAATSGTPEYIHDGGDSTYWTASDITGTNWKFGNEDQAHTGTQSIGGAFTVDGDVMQCVKGTTIDLSDYEAISGWIYVENWEDDELRIYGWDTGTPVQVGTYVNIGNYVNVGDTGIWQKFTIPFSDMNLEAEIMDAIRIEVVATVDPPDFYLDDIRLDAAGNGVAPIAFSLTPNLGKWLYVHSFSVVLVDIFTPVVTGSAVPKLSYDKLLNQTLSNGIVYHRTINGKIEFAFNFKTLAEVLSFPGLTIEDIGSDGVNMFMKLDMPFVSPHLLKPETDDSIVFTISDDLSELKFFRVFAACTEEVGE